LIKLNGQYSEVAYHSDTADVVTSDTASDEPFSFILTGDTKPQGDTLSSIVQSWAYTVGFPSE
jgi:hypothetical protein